MFYAGVSLNSQPSSYLFSESLPYQIQVADTPELLKDAIRIRYEAYKRHLPEFAEQIKNGEPEDLHPDHHVLVVISKLDGSCIGSVRIQINDHSHLSVQKSVILPARYNTKRLAEVSRLSIAAQNGGFGPRMMLIKASYLFALNMGVDYTFLCVRKALDRQYRALDLDQVFPGDAYYPMNHIGGVPHKIYCLDMEHIANDWGQRNHPLYQQFVLTHHPDLLIV